MVWSIAFLLFHPSQEESELRTVAKSLANRFVAQERFLAEYDGEGLDDDDQGRSIKKVILALDRAKPVVYLRIDGRFKGDEGSIHVLAEGVRYTAWGDNGESFRWDMTPYLEGVDEKLRVLRETLKGVLPRPAGAPMASRVLRPFVRLCMSSKATAEAEGLFSFAVGFSESVSPPGWLNDVLSEPDTEIQRRNPDVLVFAQKGARRTITIDEVSGILKSMEVVDFDGERHALRRTKLDRTSFPEIRPPDKITRKLPPMADYRSAVMSRADALFELARHVASQWNEISAEAQETAVPSVFSKGAAIVSDEIEGHYLKVFADRKINAWMNAGMTLNDLLGDIEGYARSYARECRPALGSPEFMDQVEVNATLHRRILETVEFSDAKAHASFRKMLEQALDPAATRPLRHKPSAEDFTRCFREAVDRARNL
jgi:hypothetical protein